MLFVRDLWYVCACVYESSEASAYSFGLATNPNPTRARRYPLNINPKPDPKPDSISGPAGSGRVADLYIRRDVLTWMQLWSRLSRMCTGVPGTRRRGTSFGTLYFTNTEQRSLEHRYTHLGNDINTGQRHWEHWGLIKGRKWRSKQDN